MPDSLLIGQRKGVTTLTINRPEVRNAMDDTVSLALLKALEACTEDGTRCVVITGEGEHFCSGLDIKKAFSAGLTPDQIERLTQHFRPALMAIRACPWPSHSDSSLWGQTIAGPIHFFVPSRWL